MADSSEWQAGGVFQFQILLGVVPAALKSLPPFVGGMVRQPADAPT